MIFPPQGDLLDPAAEGIDRVRALLGAGPDEPLFCHVLTPDAAHPAESVTLWSPHFGMILPLPDSPAGGGIGGDDVIPWVRILEVVEEALGYLGGGWD